MKQTLQLGEKYTVSHNIIWEGLLSDQRMFCNKTSLIYIVLLTVFFNETLYCGREKNEMCLPRRWQLTVEPPVSGHPRDQNKCPLKRGVRIWEVKKFNVEFVCMFVAGNLTKCPLMRGVRLWEVSVSGGSTVLLSSSVLQNT